MIAGGGTAGWVVAAALSNQLGSLLDITLVESDDIGTVGVGEASIPTMRSFHRLAGVDEQEFMKATQSTFKLGISFENWGKVGGKYIHSFGKVGKSVWMADFHHLWMDAKARGLAGDLGDYCPELQAALAGKFALSPEGGLNYAYHLDASLYAKFLRTITEKRGVTRLEGKIVSVNQNPDSGFITSLALDSGANVDGDFFIDCTGFRGVLIEQTLKTGYEDWSHWLPTDRALAVQSEMCGPIPPYTRAVAHDAGWRWQIPLQKRMGNGLVYCSEYMSDDEALEQLLLSLDGKVSTEPFKVKYTTGRRKKAWNKNCVALGLSSGFLEPLESTSIHLIMIGITRLMQLFPFNGVADSLIKQFNDGTSLELERIRDFIILHYKVTQREDTAFWKFCKNLDIPQSLSDRLELFKESGIVSQAEGDVFQIDSWLQVMMGQGLHMDNYHLIGRLMSDQQLGSALSSLKTSVTQGIAKMPAHHEFLKQYCGN